MAGKIRRYFSAGNTAHGFFSLYDSSLRNLNRIFILKGGPGTGKSTLMKEIGAHWVEKGYDVEYLHSPFNHEAIEGVKILSLKVGIVNGTYPNNIEPKVAGAIEEYINLGASWDSKKLTLQKEKMVALNERIEQSLQAAYHTFQEALRVHDDWEKIYISNMDFDKANQLTKKIADLFFGQMQLNKRSDVKHRFLGAATPVGAVDFIANLTEDVAKRYFIKGRPGSGKSTMLKQLAQTGEKSGFDVEIYHCGFDPNSLDMLIFRELGIAIFDSTSPHEYFPSREGDEIIDLYGTIIENGTDDIFADQIEVISAKYKAKMKAATSHLAEAKKIHDELKQIYTDATDFSIVEELKADIKAKIQAIASI